MRTPAIKRCKPSVPGVASRDRAPGDDGTSGHSIADASCDANPLNVPLSRSSSESTSSDYDIRQTFSGAVSYNGPEPGNGIRRAMFGNGSTDSIIYARSGPGECGHGPRSLRRRLVRTIQPTAVPIWFLARRSGFSNPTVAVGQEINPAVTIPTGACKKV
jgi:hypothetical protein